MAAMPTTCTGEEEVLFTLSQFSSPSIGDKDFREACEAKLDQLAKLSGFGTVVSKISLTQQIPIDTRQFALVILKKYIKEHWTNLGENFVEPEVSAEERAQIRGLLPSGLNDPTKKIRTAIAMAISQIAHWDWPNEWPNLVNDLVQCLSSNDLNLVTGAMKCLEMFATGENFSDDQVPGFVQTTFPALFQLFKNTERFSEKLRSRAVSILFTFITWFAIMKEGKKAGVFNLMAPIIPAWLDEFVLILGQDNITPTSNCGMRILILQVITVLVTEFPKHIQNHLPHLVGPVWTSLNKALRMFEENCVISDETGPDRDSDNEMIGFETYVLMFLDFLRALIENKKARSLFPKSLLSELFYLSIRYSQMTASQVEHWINEPVEMAHEEDDEGEFIASMSTRKSANQMISELGIAFKGEGYKALSDAIHRVLQETFAAKSAGNPNWWKSREAVVYAIGSSEDELQQYLDIPALFKNFLITDITDGQTNPVLKARALWAASKFANSVDVDVVLPFFEAAVACLVNANDAIPVKISATKTIESCCRKVPKEVFVKNSDLIVRGCCASLANCPSEIAHYFLETLLAACEQAPEKMAEYEEVLSQTLISTWEKNFTDPMLVQIITEIFQEMMKSKHMLVVLKNRLVPFIINTFRAPPDAKTPSGTLETNMSLLKSLVENSGAESGHEMLIHCFDDVINLLMTTDDHGLVQTGCQCLREFVSSCGGYIATWISPKFNISALELTVQFLLKLYADKSEEMGDLAKVYLPLVASKLLLSHSNELGKERVEKLMVASLHALYDAQLPSLIQAIVVFFAKAVQANAPFVLDLLSTQTCTNEGETENGLHVLMNHWVLHHENLEGHYIKLSLVGLVQLLQGRDQRLMTMMVAGDPILPEKRLGQKESSITPSGYTEVTLPVKIIQLLICEWSATCENENPDAGALGDEDEEEDEYGVINDDEFPEFWDAIGTGGFGDEVTEDPDLISSPLATMDIKSFIFSFFKALEADPTAFASLSVFMTQPEQDILREILTWTPPTPTPSPTTQHQSPQPSPK